MSTIITMMCLMVCTGHTRKEPPSAWKCFVGPINQILTHSSSVKMNVAPTDQSLADFYMSVSFLGKLPGAICFSSISL